MIYDSSAARKAVKGTDYVAKAKSFFLTDKVRNIVHGGGIVVSLGGLVGLSVIHTWWIDRYRDTIQHYENGFPVRMSPKLVELKDQAFYDVSVKHKYRRVIHLFYSYGFEPFTIGSLQLKFGVNLGVPKYFSYEKPTDVELDRIKIEGKSVRWELDEGAELKESLVLSDNAKKFAIAQQIAMSYKNYVYWHAGFFSGSLLLYQMLSKKLNDICYARQKRLLFRMGIYSVVGVLSYVTWKAAHDFYNKWLEMYGDNRAAQINLDYAKGAVEYYSKSLQRNLALRALMGPDGEKLYTIYGNDSYGFIHRTVPLTERKANAERIAEKLEKMLLEERQENGDANVVKEESTSEIDSQPIVQIDNENDNKSL